MRDAEKSPRLTCGAVVLAGALAVIVVIALQAQSRPPRWASTGAAAIAVVAVFLVERGVQNILWGLAAAALLALHPAWKGPADNSEAVEVLGGAVVLAALAATSIGWRLALHPRFAWRSWPLVAGALAACIGAAWVGQKYLGVFALALATSGLGMATLLAFGLRRRGFAEPPSWLNIAASGSAVIAVPMAGLVVYHFFDRSLDLSAGWWAMLRGAWPATLPISGEGFSLGQLHSWCWPHPWLVLPLVAWALLLTGQRGWKQWTAGTAPTAWFPLCFALVLLAALWVRPDGAGTGRIVVLTAAVVLLVVSLVADLLRRIGARLVLVPPHERDALSGELPPIGPPTIAETAARQSM